MDNKTEVPSPAKVIKRYANRKLYDTERSCYVTLDDIRDMICAGDDIQVVDNKTGEDLTTVTMTQIIFEREKEEREKGRRLMPISLLREMIQSGPNKITESVRDGFGSVQEQAAQFRDNAERIRSDISEGIAGVLRRSEENVRGGIQSAQELFSGAHRALDDLQKGVEERVHGGVNVVTRELQQLRSRLGELENRVFRARRRRRDMAARQDRSSSS